MASKQEDQFVSPNMDLKPDGPWGATPVMHSWCLESDKLDSASESPDRQRDTNGHESKRRKAALESEADDDSGLELSLGLSLGGSKSIKPKFKDKEKDSLRESLGEAKHERMDAGSAEVSAKEPFLNSGLNQPSLEQKGGERVQAFWQEFGRSEPDVREKNLSLPSRPTHTSRQAAVSESSWRPAENSVAEDSKMFARHIWQALQEKAAQPEHQRVPLSVQDEASLMKELQGLPPQAVATAAAWARYAAQGAIPMQLLEAFKDGVDPLTRGLVLQPTLSINSLSSSQHCEGLPAPASGSSQKAIASPTVDLVRSDSDVSKNISMADQQQRQVAMMQQQEVLEQQRKRELQTQKRQEARRKRKALLEGQKQSKKAKKEDDRPGSSGLPGIINGKSRPGTPPGQLARTSSLQPPSPPFHAKEGSISTVSSPPDSQDAGGVSSFTGRRSGSNSWPHNWEASPQTAGPPIPNSGEKAEKSAVRAGGNQSNEEGEQLFEIRRALQRERDRATKNRGRDIEGAPVDSGEESRRLAIPDAGYTKLKSEEGGEKVKSEEGSLMLKSEEGGSGGRPLTSSQEGGGAASCGMLNMEFGRNQMEPAWFQKMFAMQMNPYQVAAMMESARENMNIGLPALNHMRRAGDVAVSRPSSRVEPEKGLDRARASSQNSSGDSDNSDRKDEKSINGRRADPLDGDNHSGRPISSSVGADSGNQSIALSSISNSFPLPTSGAMTIGNVTYPHNPSLPLMPVPYPFPITVPAGAAGGVPFNLPFPFPYLMQFAPAPATGGEGNQDQRPHPSMPHPFLPPGYPPFQIQTPEGPAAWASAVVRPHPTTPQSPPRSAVGKRSQSGLPHEDDSRNSQGNGSEPIQSRNTSPAQDHLLRAASSMGSGAFNRLHPGPTNSQLPVPRAPQFGLSRSKSDTAVPRREGSTGSAFASLPEGQGGSNAHANLPVSNGPKASPSQGGGAMPRLERTSSRVATIPADDAVLSGLGRPATPGDSGQSEVTAAQSTCSMEEDVKRTRSGVWRQGYLPNFEGLAGQEASSLRPGVAAGQYFGGTGSQPDLPWVTCTGMGPSGNTISGVLYRVEKGQVQIVCACHGRHLTPSEFVQHAGCGEMSNPEKAIVVGPFNVASQQSASAQA